MNATNLRSVVLPVTPAIAVPDGFTSLSLESGGVCIVPEFLVPATNDAFSGYGTRLAMHVRDRFGGVSLHPTRPSVGDRRGLLITSKAGAG